MRLLLKLTPSKRDDAANILAAHEEIRGTIELQKQGGGVAKTDAAMLGGVLDLKDLQVLDIMVHRTKMETRQRRRSAAEDHRCRCSNGQYSRMPVWRDEPGEHRRRAAHQGPAGRPQPVGLEPGKIDILLDREPSPGSFPTRPASRSSSANS